MAKMRLEVDPKDCWNVEALYPNYQAWEKEFNSLFPETQTDHFSRFIQIKGTLNQGVSVVKKTIESILEMSQKIEKLYTWAHLKHDEDIANSQHKSAYEKAMMIAHHFEESISWLQPELTSLPEDLMKSYLEDDELKNYRFQLEQMLRMKEHILSADNEKLIALSARAVESYKKVFSALNDADFKFGSAFDKNGEEKELTHSLYALYLRSHDRTLRKNAAEKFHTKYLSYENTLAESLNGQVQGHLYISKARGFKNCMEAALFPKNIDLSVYHTLIETVNSRLGSLHKYWRLRKKIMGLDEMHPYDLAVPLSDKVELSYSFDEAVDLTIEACAPLGSEYQNILKKGLKKDRWIDRYENQNKRSGAYSSGCYDSMPYILMNYKKILNDVFTLAHEAGHSMHTYFSNKHQPYQYAHYPIFLAEVASTFNEDLLTKLLISRAKNKDEKIFLINQQLEDIRGTLFRQTMFAEFELAIHTFAEKGAPLTPELLRSEWRRLNIKFWSDAVVADPLTDSDWSRIPHFYYNFYVYQYSTGISAALALSKRVVEGGQKERDDYLNFLKGGGSRYPLELLDLAGVNMRRSDPIHAAIDKFDELITELESLTVGENLALN